MPNPAKPKKPSIPIEKKPWQTGIGPYYIGLCLWVVFFDRLGARALAVGGVGWSSLGALAGGLLCYLLLFRVPATWGQATGKGLADLGTSTFGRAGARWVPGLLVGLGALIWFAVSVSSATGMILKAVAQAGLLDARALGPISVGGMRLASPVMLASSLVWGVAAALAGRWLVRLIAAIMYVFPVFPAMILGGTMLAMMGGLRSFAPTGIDPLTQATLPAGREGVWAMLLIVQLIFGFFAMAGATAADWGAATTSAKDARVGGWVGACFAPTIIATVSILAVAGHRGRVDPATIGDPQAMNGVADLARSTSMIRTVDREAESTYVAVLTDGVGGRLGAGMLLILGVAALAPAVYASFVFGHRLHATFPRFSRTRWTLIGLAVAWLVAVSGMVDGRDGVFSLMGALFAPVVACLAADYWRSGGVWPGARRGVNPAGIVGWVVGVVVGLLPFGPGRLATFQPAAFWAFLAAFGAYALVAKLGGESGPVVDEPAPEIVAPAPADVPPI